VTQRPPSCAIWRRCHFGNILRADSTARRREAEMGVFVTGSSRSHQPAAWAGVGRAWEMLVRGGSSAGSLPRSRGANRCVSMLVAVHER
jgi:hypothetical protein